MRYSKVGINCLSYLLPDEVMTSEQIEHKLKPVYERLNLPFGRLELMTGIRERRLWPKGIRPSEVSAKAAAKALSISGIVGDQIDCLLHCSVSRDYVEPATSTAVHRLLNLPRRAWNFDISNACLGVLSGMVTLGNMIELGQAKCGMVVAGENSRPLLETAMSKLNHMVHLTRKEIKPWFASLTIGSAAVAVIMSHVDFVPSQYRLLGGAQRCNTDYNHLCQGDYDTGMIGEATPVMQTNSEELLKQGVAVAREAWQETKHELGWTSDTPSVICTHQVGKRHSNYLFENLGLDPSKDFATVDKMGNCGSASLPATASMAIEEGRLQPGGKMALLGIGSGINCLMLGMERVG